MRQIALDTETTGLEPESGHRIIEIGCVEIIDRTISGQTFHTKLNPEREIDKDAEKIHGHTWKMLKDSPLFVNVCDKLLSFVQGDEVVIHNAPFDLGFLDAELKRINRRTFKKETGCAIVDTLEIARKKHKGLPNNLNALSDRYRIDRSGRELHGALIDADLLAKVYLAMTSGQTNMSFNKEPDINTVELAVTDTAENLPAEDLVVREATDEELIRHKKFLEQMKIKKAK